MVYQLLEQVNGLRLRRRSGPARECPACGKLVLLLARVCRHCGFRLQPPLENAQEDWQQLRQESWKGVAAPALVLAWSLLASGAVLYFL